MAVMATWLSKTWEISPNKVVALEGLSTSYQIKKDNNTDAAGRPATNVRGMEPQTITLDTVLSTAVGMDVLAEIESWAALVGQMGPFMLAGKRFGPEKLQLLQADIGDMVVDDFGRIHQAKLTLSFQEYAPEASSAKSTKVNAAKAGSTTSKASGATPKSTALAIGTASAASYSALGIGASSSDKAAKKP